MLSEIVTSSDTSFSAAAPLSERFIVFRISDIEFRDVLRVFIFCSISYSLEAGAGISISLTAFKISSSLFERTGFSGVIVGRSMDMFSTIFLIAARFWAKSSCITRFNSSIFLEEFPISDKICCRFDAETDLKLSLI